MIEAEEIVCAILEADDEETIKDILGRDYQEEPPVPQPEEGEVERHDRWADIRIGDKHFCISYLTPVAVYLPGQGITVTSKDWSPTTKRHIVKWAEEIGMGPYRNYADLEGRSKQMSQDELTALFKKWAERVHWSKRQVRHAEKVRTGRAGLIGTPHRIDMRPHDPE